MPMEILLQLRVTSSPRRRTLATNKESASLAKKQSNLIECGRVSLETKQYGKCGG